MIEKEMLEECSEVDSKYELVMAEKKHFSKIHYLISYMHFIPKLTCTHVCCWNRRRTCMFNYTHNTIIGYV